MSTGNQKCPMCNKTVYQDELVRVAGGQWHSWCCKCPECGISLDARTAKAHEGRVYCSKHVPKPKATQVADDVLTQHCVSAQVKKTHSKEDSERTHMSREESALVNKTQTGSSIQRMKAKNDLAKYKAADPSASSPVIKTKKGPRCPKCDKPVFQDELVRVAGGQWHSWCCKCPVCGISLDARTAMAHSGEVYCKVHVPKASHTQVADDVNTVHCVSAQNTKTYAKEDSERSGMEGKLKATTVADDVNTVHCSSAQAIKTHAKEDSERSAMA